MERGPLALFGAIIAIGLGPAMWVGAQFGEVTLTPNRPSAVTSVQNDGEAARGGSGAGDAPVDAEEVRAEPKSNNKPLSRIRDARPVATKSVSPSPSASPSPSGKPSSPSTGPSSPDPDESESEPPTESSSPPEDPPPPADEEPDVPPQPPTDPSTGADEPRSDPGTVQVSLV